MYTKVVILASALKALSCDDPTKSQERLVDVSSLARPLVLRSRPPNVFGAGKVDEVEFSLSNIFLADSVFVLRFDFHVDLDLENAVRAGRVRVHDRSRHFTLAGSAFHQLVDFVLQTITKNEKIN